MVKNGRLCIIITKALSLVSNQKMELYLYMSPDCHMKVDKKEENPLLVLHTLQNSLIIRHKKCFEMKMV